jgi:protein-disulfide isomerase
MENGDRNLNRWVEERLSHLEVPATWSPDADRGLAGVRSKNRTVRRRRLGLSVAGLAALASALFTIPGCEAATCKVKSDNLAERLWKSVFVPEAPMPPRPPGPAKVDAPPLPSPAPDRKTAMPAARTPITCEIYTDFECPACARFYLEVVPQLQAEYVVTGKIALRHRDLPLAMHRYSRLAARYANAAAAAGQYEIAMTQLFRTQASWGLTGDIEGQLSQVLSPEVMPKVRELVHSDPHLDDRVIEDVKQGQVDRILRTPSVVVVKDGERRLLPTAEYGAIKAALDALLHP